MDAITHSDTTNVGDCQVNLAGFGTGDINVSHVHLYVLHSTDTSSSILRT